MAHTLAHSRVDWLEEADGHSQRTGTFLLAAAGQREEELGGLRAHAREARLLLQGRSPVSQPAPRQGPLVRAALGIHPLRAAAIGSLELSLFGRLPSRTDYVGEIGLDRSREGRETFAAQRRVVERVLEHPETRKRVLTVHSRGAETEKIEMLAGQGSRRSATGTRAPSG